MSLYLIADFVVDFNEKYEYFRKKCVDFKCSDDKSADFVVNVTEDDIKREYLLSDVKYSKEYLESICAYRKLCFQLPLNDAMLLHSSVIAFENRGIAFLARSGVGKTTHTKLWKKVYDDKVKIINGDKPIIRFVDDIPFAFGTPWAGKENYYLNEKVELTDICFLERGITNRIKRASTGEFFNFFMNQVLLPNDEDAVDKTLELVDRLLSYCNLWSIKCNMNDDAAVVVHDKIFSEEYK